MQMHKTEGRRRRRRRVKGTEWWRSCRAWELESGLKRRKGSQKPSPFIRIHTLKWPAAESQTVFLWIIIIITMTQRIIWSFSFFFFSLYVNNLLVLSNSQLEPRLLFMGTETGSLVTFCFCFSIIPLSCIAFFFGSFFILSLKINRKRNALSDFETTSAVSDRLTHAILAKTE